MVFAFGFMNYWIKVSALLHACCKKTNNVEDSLSGARETFGVTYAIGRAAALVLHVDVAMILFRMSHAGAQETDANISGSCL